MNESNVDSELEKAACLLCGSSDLYSIYKNNSIETPINIVACPNDGLREQLREQAAQERALPAAL